MFRMLFRSACYSFVLFGWTLAALSLHVVRTPGRIGLIPKQRLGFTDTFVDARKWTLADLPAHAQLVQRVLQADKAELFEYLIDPSKGDAADQLNAAIEGSPALQPTPSIGKIDALLAPAGLSLPKALDSTAWPVDF